MRLVVDASVALKWLLRGQPNELHVAEAEAVGAAVERSGTELFAPVHWIAEVISVLARTKPAAIDDALILLDDMRPVFVSGAPVLKRAAGLSIALSHHLFDTLYHAVALEVGAVLVTADEAYFNKAKGRGAIQLLGDFRA
ncbi:MAG TPA: type II toxin-antitoxin system VapC family toxin [Hyphomicrobiaceae bacterium]